MNWFHNMPVGKRLFSVILNAIFGLITIAAVSFYELGHVYTAAGYASVNTVPSLLVLDEASEALGHLRVLTYQHILTRDAAAKANIEEKIREEKNRIDAAFKKYEPLVSDDKDKSLLADDRAALSSYDTVREKVLALSREHVGEEAERAAQNELFPAGAKLDKAINDQRDYNVGLGRAGAANAETIIVNAKLSMAVIALATLGIIATLGTLMARKLLQQLGGEPKDAAEIANKVASGDLTVSINTQEGDQSSLMFALKNMRDNLVNIVSEVRSGTDTIASASSQVAGGNLDLSSRTEQQASSLEETASSMEELTATVKQNADNARRANQLAESASEIALRGGAVVSEVVGTMGAINESAKKITDIIAVIDGIAFQTNILALNAAVEAARAGEQGRGFAVVASEVRNLAQRSAGAAKEIKALIGDSVEKIDSGAKLVDQAGETMGEVVASVKSVTAIMVEISAASREQTSGIEQINQAIAQMDEVTQQNASLVEEAAAASESLQDQARSLAQTVSVFKLNVAPAAPAAAGFTAKASGAPRTSAGVVALRKKHSLAAKPSPANEKSFKVAANATGQGGDWEEF